MNRTEERKLAYYRARTHELLDPDADEGLGFYVNWFIMGLIAANVAAVILETVDPIQVTYGAQLRLFEIISVVLFTVEYIARLWAKLEEYDGTNPITSRLQAAREPMLLIDLLAILPFYLTLLGVGIDLRFLRSLRLIRLLRLLKLVRYSESMRAFGRAFQAKKDQLIVALTANLILLIVASSLMFFAEQHAQPGEFGSIPETMWWGIATLTTVGYGDVTPITPTGQLLGGIVAVLGIGLFALPASILASGFIEESSYDTTRCPDCGHSINWEQDIQDQNFEYRIGDRVRIDISSSMDPTPYEYHGKHGEIVDIDEGQNQYRIKLDDDEKLDVTESELRQPIQ